MTVPEHWNVPDDVYPPREDSLLLASVLEQQDFTDKTVVDMGTGSGLQAFKTLENGAQHVTCVDVNPAALACAKANLEAQDVAVEHVDFVESDLFQHIDGRFDVLVFNPPYVPGEEELGTVEEKSWQGGKQGREVTDRFLDSFASHLTETGMVFLLQSSLNNVKKTVTRFEEAGFDAEVVAREKVPWEELVVLQAVRE